MIARNRLSAGDLCEISGATMKRLRMLVEVGVIEPVEGGDGQGDHRLYDVPHALALTMFVSLVDGGLRGEAIARVPEYLVGFSEDELRDEFRAGRTHLLVAPDAVRLVRPPCEGLDSLNVATTYREVLAAIDTLEAELRQPKGGRGRRRGLGMAR